MASPKRLADALSYGDAPVMREYIPTWRDRIASALMGDDRASPERRNFVSGLVGSAGLGNTGLSVADATPIGDALGLQEAYTQGDKTGMMMSGAGLVPGAIAAKLGAVAAADKLLSLHNMKSHRLDMVDKLGGLPVPSIAITKPAQGFNGFGDITLVGGKEFATPSRLNPVYGSDVYSPRFPSIDEDTGRIFKGFTYSGNRRYAPLTMENVVKEMKGNVRGGEGFNYGAGNVRAAVTPQFRNLQAVQNARGNIVSPEQFKSLKDQTNNKLFELADKFHQFSRYSDSSFGHAQSFSGTLSDIGRGRHSAWDQDYKDLPQELKQEAYDYLASLKNMPTEYFEAKPQRAVSLNEFSGAVVPHHMASEVTPWLQNKGVNRIETFDNDVPGAQSQALSKFKDLMFGLVPFGLGGAAFGATHSQDRDTVPAM